MGEVKQGPEGLWEACSEMEEGARRILSPVLAPFWVPLRDCYEAIRHFELNMGCEQSDDLQDFFARMGSISADTVKAHETVAKDPLPFSIRDSWLH